jgi:hypothetical protein
VARREEISPRAVVAVVCVCGVCARDEEIRGSELGESRNDG